MEDVYTIKVRSKPDTRNLYPSERRYSASTVNGLAWVHIALAATSFLLACLAIMSPAGDAHINHLLLNETEQTETTISNGELLLNPIFDYSTDALQPENQTEMPYLSNNRQNNAFILVIAPAMLTVFALCAGIASIMASVRWYVDRNITWLFVMSILSTLCSFASFVMVLVWFVMTSEGSDDATDFYKEKLPFKDYFIVKHSDVVQKNDTHFVVPHTRIAEDENEPHSFRKRVLSVNILIAAFIEFLWSILSIKIAYKGMRSSYKDDDEPRGGNCISVVTTIKGNDPKRLNKNGKILPPKPDLIEHYPNKKIKRIFLAQNDDGFFLRNQNISNKRSKPNTEMSSDFYKERMINFLNGCAVETVSNPDVRTPSVQSETALNGVPEVLNANVAVREKVPETAEVQCVRDRMTPVSWGDSPEHTIYNQNNVNFDSIFKFGAKNQSRENKDCMNEARSEKDNYA